ncbi:MAG: hypothetical protein LLF96_13170 [Eubacteriales bacterium]|nr:hypothetical protein [Eubacteriales bacterium]
MFQTPWLSPHRSPGDSPAATPDATQPDDAQDDATPTDAANETPEAATNEELKAALLKAVQERTRRAETSVVRSMAEQNGVAEETMAAMLSAARAAQTEALPPEAQSRLDALNADVRRRLMMAEVKSVGTELGLIDPDVALTLLAADALTVAEDGTVTGVREALESLKARKGYLFAMPARGAWAQRVSSGVTPQLSGVEEAFYRKNPALRG